MYRYNPKNMPNRMPPGRMRPMQPSCGPTQRTEPVLPDNIATLPIAMAYVPWQEWKTVYEGTETSPDVISLASPEKTNRVRVTFTAVAEDRYQSVTLWEMGVFGIGPEIETPPEEQEPNTGTGDASQLVWLAAAAALCALSLPLCRAARKESEA